MQNMGEITVSGCCSMLAMGNAKDVNVPLQDQRIQACQNSERNKLSEQNHYKVNGHMTRCKVCWAGLGSTRMLTDGARHQLTHLCDAYASLLPSDTAGVLQRGIYCQRCANAVASPAEGSSQTAATNRVLCLSGVFRNSCCCLKVVLLGKSGHRWIHTARRLRRLPGKAGRMISH